MGWGRGLAHVWLSSALHVGDRGLLPRTADRQGKEKASGPSESQRQGG